MKTSKQCERKAMKLKRYHNRKNNPVKKRETLTSLKEDIKRMMNQDFGKVSMKDFSFDPVSDEQKLRDAEHYENINPRK